MANQTVVPTSVHGTDPQNLVEKIVRSRIHQSRYWNEECFGLSAETLVDKAIALNEVGGTYGGNLKASRFLCLTLKLLQLNPEKEIIIEFIKNDDYRYMRCLGAFYLRLTGKHKDIYDYLEPLYADYRRLRRRTREGKLVYTHVDVFIDELLHAERVCDVILPHLLPRRALEEDGRLEPRMSILEEELQSDSESNEEIDKAASLKRSRSPSIEHRRSRSPSPELSRRRPRSPSRSRSRSRERESRAADRRSPHIDRRTYRSRSTSRERYYRSRRRGGYDDERRDVLDDRSGRNYRDDRRFLQDRRRSRSRERYTRRSRSPPRHQRRSSEERRARRRSVSRSPSPQPHRERKTFKPWKGKHQKQQSNQVAAEMKDERQELDEANALRAKLGLKPLR